METIIHAAVEEICSTGTSGISLTNLHRRLHPRLSSSGLTLSPPIKQALFSGISAIPGIQFKELNGSEFDPRRNEFDGDGDGLELIVYGDEKIRKCFVGLYDVKSSHITPAQQSVLERLALAREAGVTQNQLCKELGIPANNFFYVVKRLESWGLIVRHSTIVRTKEATSQPVHTNLIRLQRYAPSLKSQQRLEITKESNNLDDNHRDSVTEADAFVDECGQDDVLVNDFLPKLKAVCDRLEKAKGKVLVVADIKRELDYRETRGHRAWRNVCNKLKQAGLIELFDAHVSSGVENSNRSNASRPRKPVSCLKLVRKFSPKLFEHRTTDCEYDNLASDQHVASGKQVPNTGQLVELPLTHQIVDMIDAEGSKGLLGVEVCKRLGISHRQFDNLINPLVSRFGLHQLSENHKRGLAYRFWTRGNFCPQLPNSSLGRLEHSPAELRLTVSRPKDSPLGENPRITTTLAMYLNSQNWINEDNNEKGISEEDPKNGPREDRGTGEMVSDNVTHDMSITFPHEVNGAQSYSIVEASSSPVPKLFNLQQGRLYPSVTSTMRNLWILEILKTEKIIVRPELQHRLDSIEKDNESKMASKTLHRCLKNLQLEGHCKVMEFNVPGVSNFGRPRVVPVVVHSSVKGSASELSEQVHEKIRLFQLQNRSSLSKLTKESPVPALHGIERIQMYTASDAGGFKPEAFRANGFFLRKMVRAKLVHGFLWKFVINLARCADAPTSAKHINSSDNPHGSCVLFSLDAAIKAMPLELFLQAVGSPLDWADMIEKSKSGALLSDFPDEEYKALVNNHAFSRLSRLTDILSRLKLIRLVADESPKDADNSSQATLVYALDLKPYIEEPPSVDPLTGCSSSIDLRPHFRHDFVLSTVEAVEKYWQTLESCYAAADPKAIKLAFPGSVAYTELRVYFDNRQNRLTKLQGDVDVQVTAPSIRNIRRRSQRKMKRLLEKNSAKDTMTNYPTDSLDVREDEPEEQRELSPEQCDMPMLIQSREPKFIWTEDADRKLITLYARQSTLQGSTFGTKWSTMSDLPAKISMCRRRLSILRKDAKFWNSLIRLCELLSQRYAECVDHEKNLTVDNSEELTSPGKYWDDFEDSYLKAALDEVLMIRQMLKVDPTQKTEASSQDPDEAIATTPCELEDDNKPIKESVRIDERVHHSLAISSAIELLKLDFFTNSKSVDMPDFLSETFRRYSQLDLNAAVDYLTHKKIMIGSNPQYMLSQSFVTSLSSSQLPMNTGKRAARLATRIRENKKRLMEGAVNLRSDLQCGDIYQTMSLISSGELSISPVLPHEGIGEADDSRSSKRKYEDYDYDNFGTSKKHRFHSLQSSETSSRREKGFPGITVSLRRSTILRSNVVEFCNEDAQNPVLSNSVKSSNNHFKEAPDFSTITPSTIISGQSIWEVMANFSTHNLSNHDRDISLVNSGLIKSTYINIQKAGDQGLSMAKVSECIGIRGTVVSEDIVDVLELFGYVVKVNGYNYVHIVDSLYRSKYFLTSKPTLSQDAETTQSATLEKIDTAAKVVKESKGIPHEAEVNCLNADDVHKVTILNLPEDSWHAIPDHDNLEGCSKTSTTCNTNQSIDSGSVFHPILPWINRDGSINDIVYSGLRRRILGIVALNPAILEDGILTQMRMLTPQCCRKLLELMVLDKHLFVRKMCQKRSSTTIPTLLATFIGNHFKKPKYVCREHYFFNPTSTVLL